MPQKHPDPFVNIAAELNAGANPYVGVLREAGETGSLPLAFGPVLRAFPGQWRERVAAYHGLAKVPERLIVEIGCYKGHTLLTLAKDHPDTAFIGIDITFKRVVMSAQRVVATGVRNTFCALANAAGIDQLFAPDELDGCLIFYPDPWIRKKRQAKNRLVEAAFCERLRSRLAPGGFCWLKTDQQPYFERASAALLAAGFSPTPPRPGTLFGRDVTSTFEQRFHQQGLPTYAAAWLKEQPHAFGSGVQARPILS